MEQLIFFAIIVFFSIIDSIARKKKKQQQQMGTGVPVPTTPDARERKRSVPRYDTERTHDAKPTYEAERTYEAQPSYDADPSYDDDALEEAGGVSEKAGSEALIPADIWEEIAGLARGKTSAPTRPIPPPPPAPVVPPTPVETHIVHRAHRGYGTDPSSRQRSQQDGLDPLATRTSADALAVRAQLRRQGAHALRQAVIFHEILGPPAAIRPDRFEEYGT
jgi:hypothetical protein